MEEYSRASAEGNLKFKFCVCMCDDYFITASEQEH